MEENSFYCSLNLDYEATQKSIETLASTMTAAG